MAKCTRREVALIPVEVAQKVTYVADTGHTKIRMTSPPKKTVGFRPRHLNTAAHLHFILL